MRRASIAAFVVVIAAALAGAATGQSVRAARVTVRMAVTHVGADVSGGKVAGRGHFTAKGGIRDTGSVVVYRTVKGAAIILRAVSSGKKGRLTFIITIDTSVGTSRWVIASGTRAYRGLHGSGVEHENATYTVSTLTGSVWH
jgi:hypothetical protein